MNLEFILCTLSFSLPLFASALVYLFGKKPYIKEYISILSLIISFIASSINLNFLSDKVFIWLDIIYLDGFSILMQLVTVGTALLVVLFSINYISTYQHRKKSHHLYYAVILLCTGFMNLSFSLNNLFFVYITLELSSIFAVYLISFRHDKESFYASFKYLVFVNIGILFSLIGIILFSFFSSSLILIGNLREKLLLLNKDIVFICAAFFIIGFFTKSGLIPFHLWLPDTYKESPTPITVFLSGALTKIGFYGLARTVTVFSFSFEEIRTFLIILASISMLLGATVAFNQRDIKKLIAYCSISEMGFIAAALSTGSYEGVFGGVFHIINHTLIKGILFFSVGAISYIDGKAKSIITTPYFIGAFSAAGMPLFGSFLSATTIFFAMVNEGFLLSSIVLIVAEFIIGISLIKYGISEFWQKNNLKEGNQKIPLLMIVPILILCILIIVFGVYPKVIYTFIDIAANSILKMKGVVCLYLKN
ncbi:MAG: proton-conducting transporter membrane subunit [Thermodesulfovibrionaceae bacterium]